MNLINKVFSSIWLAIILLFIYAVSAAVATLIENDFGTSVAQYLVYRSWWYNILHLLLVINMIFVFFKYKMYEKKRFSIFLFHLAFIIIIIGAGITRFISYEGSMHIREGATSNSILTYESYLHINIDNGSKIYKADIPVNFNVISGNKFSDEFEFDGQKFKIVLKEFIPNAGEIIQETETGIPIISFTALNNDVRHDLTMSYGDMKWAGDQLYAFGIDAPENAVIIDYRNDTLYFKVNKEVKYSAMRDTVEYQSPAGNDTPLNRMFLYSWDNNALVLTKFYPKAEKKIVSRGIKSDGALNAMYFDVEHNGQKQELLIFGKDGYLGKANNVISDNYKISISYGPKEIKLPFSIKLNDFILKRYPGSMSPASYESHVTLIDKRHNLVEDYKIFMNNVLEYEHYRFFQSSYDQDEKGTILSVNHDYWGTLFTYVGYILLAVGMAWSLINKNSRFMQLSRKIKELNAKSILIIGFLIASQLSAQAQTSEQLPQIDKAHAKKFGELLLQDRGGRIKPVNTMTNEVLRKLSHRSTFHGMNSDQVYLSMMLRPDLWAKTPIIKIKHPELIKRFNAQDDLVALSDVFDQNANYILHDEVEAAYSKGPAKQNMMDKGIIMLDERVNILYTALSGGFLNIFPDKYSENHKWENVQTAKNDTAIIYRLAAEYITALQDAVHTGNWQQADKALDAIKQFQEENGKSILVNRSKIKAEIFYNKSAIFRHLFEFYFIIGLFYLAYLILIILFPKLSNKYVDLITRILIYIAFAAHTFGLGLRWYISGHAPWSNGYESMIYIAWVTLLAGLVFAKRNKISLAATTSLGGVVLLIAHLSWIDPEITNLVPVLNSYWLTIHVAVIIASYGFLGLGAILGFVNLILMIVKNRENKKRIDKNILQLSYTSEMSLIAGLYLLTVGTFLGGVWANESWGRYWGWDPKETWALISVLVYAIVVHLRLIPSLKGLFTFNFLALISYASVGMTYFGVNYYLSGLHSYASGDPVPIPNSVYYTLAVILIVANIAYLRDKKLPVEQEKVKDD